MLFVSLSNGQEKTEPEAKKDTEVVAKTSTIDADSIVVYKKNYGLRLGIDIVKPILSAVKTNYKS